MIVHFGDASKQQKRVNASCVCGGPKAAFRHTRSHGNNEQRDSPPAGAGFAGRCARRVGGPPARTPLAACLATRWLVGAPRARLARTRAHATTAAEVIVRECRRRDFPGSAAHAVAPTARARELARPARHTRSLPRCWLARAHSTSRAVHLFCGESTRAHDAFRFSFNAQERLRARTNTNTPLWVPTDPLPWLPSCFMFTALTDRGAAAMEPAGQSEQLDAPSRAE